MIEAHDITHRFGDRTILDHVDLRLDEGDCVALIGPNGAGKTTLLRILAGLLEPTSGRVQVDGDGLRNLDRRQAARRIGFVPQGRPVVFDYTVFEYVLMGFHARNGRFSLETSEQRQRATNALDDLDVAQLAEQPLNTLSGGELQRVVMARTMVTDTTFWLLDEPTSSLDPRHQVVLLERVVRHTECDGAALAVLHDLGLVHRYFSRVLALHRGRIVADGEPGEVLTEQLMSDVYEIELRRLESDGTVVWTPR